MVDMISYRPKNDAEEDGKTIRMIQSELIAIAENRAGTKDITYSFYIRKAKEPGYMDVVIKSRKRRKRNDKRAENQKGR